MTHWLAKTARPRQVKPQPHSKELKAFWSLIGCTDLTPKLIQSKCSKLPQTANLNVKTTAAFFVHVRALPTVFARRKQKKVSDEVKLPCQRLRGWLTPFFTIVLTLEFPQASA